MHFVKINIREFGTDKPIVINLDNVVGLQKQEFQNDISYKLILAVPGIPREYQDKQGITKLQATLQHYILSDEQGRALELYISFKSINAAGQPGTPDLTEKTAKAPAKVQADY